MRRNFLKSAAAAGIGLAGASAFAQQQAAAPAAGAGLRGNASDVYVMNVMVSGVEYWFPVYEMMKQLGRTLGVRTRYTGTPEYDVNKQLASFEQELARKPAGILLHPMNPDPFIGCSRMPAGLRASSCSNEASCMLTTYSGVPL